MVLVYLPWCLLIFLVRQRIPVRKFYYLIILLCCFLAFPYCFWEVWSHSDSSYIACDLCVCLFFPFFPLVYAPLPSPLSFFKWSLKAFICYQGSEILQWGDPSVGSLFIRGAAYLTWPFSLEASFNSGTFFWMMLLIIFICFQPPRPPFFSFSNSSYGDNGPSWLVF